MMRSAGFLLLRAICLYLLLVIADVPIVCADERPVENAPSAVTAGSDREAATLSNAGRAVLLKHRGPTGVTGMLLAAVGWLPPILAAAAQALPDVAVMLNSARLLRRA